MSLSYDHGDIVFQCDTKGCREMIETYTSNWESARNALRRAHWKPNRDPITQEYRHTCSECQKGLI